ncbi:site-specific integrase [Lactobacillus terrae]|uniref:site-specific integrase n=1 Tax=Lactobacillus terrae TaxID=2269374 RepID=UPI000C1B6DBB|nr:site-specific integrase [Lactobacillus terrae]
MASIYKRGKTWTYEVSYYENGKKHKTTKGGFKRQTDAKNAAIEIESKKNTVGLSDSENITFANYFKNWVEVYKVGKVSTGTELKYKTVVTMIENYFGNKLMKDVKKQEYQKFIDEIAKTHVKDTVARFNGYIRRSLGDALEDQITYRDFTRNIVISGSTEKLHPMNYLNESEIAELKSYCEENYSLFDISTAEILFGLLTGCRYGEVTGLTWDCVDFNQRTVDINKSYDYMYRTGFKPTKTKSSNRTISINKDVYDLLKSINKQQSTLFLNQGYSNSDNFVFINNKHEVPSSNAVNKKLKSILNIIKSDNVITFHGLRHTHASMLIAKNVSLDYISERLGHADTSITSKIYIHLLKEKREQENKKAINILDNL